MTTYPLIAFLAVAAMAALTYVSLPLGRHRVLATAIFLTLSAGAFAGGIEMLGGPRPVSLEWRDMKGLAVVGISPNEKKHQVYVWAMRDEIPVAYIYPWPDKGSELSDLLDHWRRRQQTGEQFFLTGDMQKVAKVVAPQPLPDKNTTAN